MHSGGSYLRLWSTFLSYPVMIHFFSPTYIPAFLGRRITVFHLSLSPSLPMFRFPYRYYQYSNI